MKKRLLCLVLCLTMALSLTAYAEEAPAVSILVDGAAVADPSAQTCGGVTYVSLHRLTLALWPEAKVEWEDDRAVARAENLVLSAKIGAFYLDVNGRCLYIPDGVKQSADGETLVPARTLAEALGATVAWTGAVEFTTGGTPLAAGDTFYDAQSVDLIARIITHESGYQPLAGKIAVGNVILNRVASPKFPNTIYDVIHEENQFPGATDAAPNAESVLAAKLCLDGAVTAPGAYWFNGAGKSCWASRNKTLVATILRLESR